jgi:hypothetical protein
MIAKGFDGQVEFDGRAVTIRRRGLMARTQHHGRDETQVPLRQITAVEFKGAGLRKGRFTILTGGARQRGGGFVRHRNDPLSVEFQPWQAAAFRELRDAIQQAINSYDERGQQPPSADLAGQLDRLAQLHQTGRLTDVEYAAAKARLLT